MASRASPTPVVIGCYGIKDHTKCDRSHKKAAEGRKGKEEDRPRASLVPPRGRFTHISALLRFLASVIISWSRTETSSVRGRNMGFSGENRLEY